MPCARFASLSLPRQRHVRPALVHHHRPQRRRTAQALSCTSALRRCCIRSGQITHPHSPSTVSRPSHPRHQKCLLPFPDQIIVTAAFAVHYTTLRTRPHLPPAAALLLLQRHTANRQSGHSAGGADWQAVTGIRNSVVKVVDRSPLCLPKGKAASQLSSDKSHSSLPSAPAPAPTRSCDLTSILHAVHCPAAQRTIPPLPTTTTHLHRRLAAFFPPRRRNTPTPTSAVHRTLLTPETPCRDSWTG